MAKKEKPTKQNTTFRIDPDVLAEAHRRASDGGQSMIWWIENTLAVAWGLRDWPKQPKGINKAKELAK